MSTRHRIYFGPLAVGYIATTPFENIEELVTPRLWSPLHEEATHHWVPTQPGSSPTLQTLFRYEDGTTGSFVVHTSSEQEIALFEAEFQNEIEKLKTRYDMVEIIFGAVSYLS